MYRHLHHLIFTNSSTNLNSLSTATLVVPSTKFRRHPSAIPSTNLRRCFGVLPEISADTAAPQSTKFRQSNQLNFIDDFHTSKIFGKIFLFLLSPADVSAPASSNFHQQFDKNSFFVHRHVGCATN